jgi:hypothetical protein
MLLPQPTGTPTTGTPSFKPTALPTRTPTLMPSKPGTHVHARTGTQTRPHRQAHADALAKRARKR